MLERFVERLLPPTTPQDRRARKSRFLVLVTLTSLVFDVVAAVVIGSYFHVPSLSLLLWIAAALHLVTLMLLRSWGLTLLTLLVSANHLIILLSMAYLFYQERAVFFLWIPYVILLTTYIRSRRVGAGILVLTIAVVWVLEVRYNNGYAFPD